MLAGPRLNSWVSPLERDEFRQGRWHENGDGKTSGVGQVILIEIVRNTEPEEYSATERWQ